MIIRDVLCVVLGGGRGTRLYPLTLDRAKPAVPLFAKYRLIDIPISNCLNSGFNKIKILTQFNSESLNKHISRAYKLDQFSQGYIEIIAADQSMDNMSWFQGPADAVRKSLRHFVNPKIRHVCILSGDQLYKMDLTKFYERHLSAAAQVSVACCLVKPGDVSAFGILGVDKDGRVRDFVEKPKDAEGIAHMCLNAGPEKRFLCSMGIYFFDIDVLRELLTKSNKADFGREIIPEAIAERRVFSYRFQGYWRDIGTIKSFYSENLRLTEEKPPLDLFDENWPIFTRSRALPPAKYQQAGIERSIVADGSLIGPAMIKGSIIGLRSNIGAGCLIEDSIIMGADYYETPEAADKAAVGIGPDCVIKKAILDKNVRLGRGVQIINQKGLDSGEGPGYVIRDGIVIVCKNAVIPAGSVI